MTHVPSDSKAWPKAGAADKAAASGEQIKDKLGSEGSRAKDTGSDLPAAGGPTQAGEPGGTFPEARREEGEGPGKS